MKLYSKKIVIASIVMGMLPLLFIFPCFGANISDGYPGYPNTWQGLTTNTKMLIELDSAVAMIGNQPDMTYCVKKLTISGFDYVFTDVTCDAAASDDRKSVSLYPQALLDINSRYAYKVASINFQGGGSAQNFNQCYITGNNPVIPPAYSINEADMCTDYNNPDLNALLFGNFCFKCHVNGYAKFPPGDIGYIPSCTP